MCHCQILHNTIHPVTKEASLPHQDWYTHSERRRRNHLPWCNFRQEADMEAAYHTHRGKGTQEASMRKLAGTTWGANTQDNVRGISETRPGVQPNSMVYNCKYQPTIPSQDSKLGTTHHYRRNEVHTHHNHGANHRYTTSTTETTSKGPFSSREIQVPPRSSHEGEGRGPYQEQT